MTTSHDPFNERYPSHPQDRRTFHFAGRPYYFVEVGGRLSLRAMFQRESSAAQKEAPNVR